jgi:predicted lipoprotein with Yx(FWY)xxD motif
MKRNRLITASATVLLAGVVSLVIATSGGSGSKLKPGPLNATGALNIKHTSLGNTLVDGAGRTVYLFEADKANRSTLSREGFAVWPAVASTGKPHAGNGVSAANLETIRTRGVSQLTYYRHPLYYYVGDKMRGETNGQGLKEFGGLWYVLSPQGKATTTKPTTPAVRATESPGYRY